MWYEQNWIEEICMFCLTAIAIVSIFKLDSGATNIVSAISGGLVGYLTRALKSQNNSNGAP